MENPCIFCDKRHATCHANCRAYITWKAEHDQMMEKEKRRKRDEYVLSRSYHLKQRFTGHAR